MAPRGSARTHSSVAMQPEAMASSIWWCFWWPSSYPHEGQAHWAGMTDLVFGRHNGVDGVGDVRANAGEVCASVEEQVECLLALATDPGVLANGWSGWRPWL